MVLISGYKIMVIIKLIFLRDICIVYWNFDKVFKRDCMKNEILKLNLNNLNE